MTLLSSFFTHSFIHPKLVLLTLSLSFSLMHITIYLSIYLSIILHSSFLLPRKLQYSSLKPHFPCHLFKSHTPVTFPGSHLAPTITLKITFLAAPNLVSNTPFFLVFVSKQYFISHHLNTHFFITPSCLVFLELIKIIRKAEDPN